MPSISGELVWGVETCVQPDRMVPRAKRSVEMGEEPILLNGGAMTECTSTRQAWHGIVRTWGRLQNQKLFSRDVQ